MLRTMAGMLVLGAMAGITAAADDCPYRGELDALYCDADRNLVADPPKDPKKFRNPSTMVFTYTPIEDPAVYQNLFKPFQDYLAQCTGKKILYYQVQSNAAQIEAMRAGRLHLAGFSTGPTGFAVNLAGAVPFAAKGAESGVRGYTLAVIVKRDSPYQRLADLKGKKIAHTSPSSNSGNLAPRALFPAEGLVPDKDYKVLYSGKHDQSILGVNSGDYDAAAIASDVLERMAGRGTVKREDFRIIFESRKFPSSSFAYAHDLDPQLAERIKTCFFAYRFTPEMTKEFQGDDRFHPIDFKRDWELVRKVAESSGEAFNRDAYERDQARELAAKKK